MSYICNIMKKLKYTKEFKEFEKDLNEAEFLFEMANYYEDVTGLPMVIWVGSKSKAKHGPRIKVQRNYIQRMDSSDLFTVSISDDPQIVAGNKGSITTDDLGKVFKWVIVNKDILLQLWRMEFRDFHQFEKLIKKWDYKKPDPNVNE